MGMYALMHKDDVCAILNMDETGEFEGIEGVKNTDKVRFPLDDAGFKRWWEERAICWSGYEGLMQEVLSDWGLVSTKHLLLDNYAVSLNDHYWVKPINGKISWKDISPYSVKFDDRFGTAIYNGVWKVEKPTNIIYSISTPGNMVKCWVYYKNGSAYLSKFGTKHQCLNEVFCHKISSWQSFTNHVSYLAGECAFTDYWYCASANFCSEEVEFVPLVDYIRHLGIFDEIRKEGVYGYLRYLLRDAGVTFPGLNVSQSIGYIKALDILVCNEGRDTQNVGLLIRSSDGRCIGIAPLFGFDDCLGYSNKDAFGFLGSLEQEIILSSIDPIQIPKVLQGYGEPEGEYEIKDYFRRVRDLGFGRL